MIVCRHCHPHTIARAESHLLQRTLMIAPIQVVMLWTAQKRYAFQHIERFVQQQCPLLLLPLAEAHCMRDSVSPGC